MWAALQKQTIIVAVCPSDHVKELYKNVSWCCRCVSIPAESV